VLERMERVVHTTNRLHEMAAARSAESAAPAVADLVRHWCMHSYAERDAAANASTSL
jgi:hypothetical protein